MVSGNVPRQYWNSITQNGPWHSFGQLAYDQNDSDYTIGYSSENVSNLLEKKPTNQPTKNRRSPSVPQKGYFQEKLETCHLQDFMCFFL